MKSNKSNIRTDIIKRKRHPKEQLFRVVFSKNEQKLYLDLNYEIQGRGFYILKNSNDKLFLNHKILEKNLKQKNMYEETSYQNVIHQLENIKREEKLLYDKK